MSSSNENNNNAVEHSALVEQTQPKESQNQPLRRVGRVERWLRKGYGFITDIGAVNRTDNSYGWTKDTISNSKVFVYHNALVSQSEQIFHRLYAHELVEYTIDTSKATRDNRFQAFNVTGLQGELLLCDLNSTNDDGQDEEPVVQRSRAPNNNNRRPPIQRGQQQQQHQQQQHQQQRGAAFVPPAGATVVYYVPQQGPTQAAEPSYLMPMSGIPTPK